MNEALPYPPCMMSGGCVVFVSTGAWMPEPCLALPFVGGSGAAPPEAARDHSRSAMRTAATCLQCPWMVENGGQLHSEAKPPGVTLSETW